MTIPDEIKRSYQAGREDPLDQMCAHLCDAIREMLAGWLEAEHKNKPHPQPHDPLWPNQPIYRTLLCETCRTNWLAEADKLLMEKEEKTIDV